MTRGAIAPVRRSPWRLAAVALATVAAWPPLAAQTAPTAPTAPTPPDAGDVLRDLAPPPAPPAPRRPGALPPATADDEPVAPGGATVVLRGLRIDGATLIAADVLAAGLDDAVGRRFDLHGLRTLADRVSARYRDAGYPFVRTVLPPQDLGDGVLRLQVIEGRYGRVDVRADDPAHAGDAVAARAFVATLRPGAPIEAAALERASLLLDELPGVRSRAVLRPGDAVGEGDLAFALEREAPWIGDVAIDNHGNRYSGEWRLQGHAEGRSLWHLGDRLEIDALASDGDLRHGTLAYGAPVGGDGARARASIARTSYALGREFAALDAHGDAWVAAAGVGIAPWRSATGRLDVQVELQSKRLDDRQDRTATASGKRSLALPVTLRFDHRDVDDGALTWGSIALTAGRLTLDDASAAADRLRTAGTWQTIRVDLSHRRPLAAGWTLSLRGAGQWADRNLDASEGFSLGGAQGVRAYPAGEAPGDTGWLVQAELARPMVVGVARLEPFVFHDRGQSVPDRDPLPGERSPTRTLAGWGVGLRATQGPWRAELAVATRTQGGAPTSVPQDARTRAWLTIGRRF